MKKKVSKLEAFTPSVDKSNFQSTNALPTTEQANKSVEALTGQIETEIKKLKMTGLTTERNQRKRETIKGTILQSVMIEMEVLKKVKLEAFTKDISLSDVINNALKQYFQ